MLWQAIEDRVSRPRSGTSVVVTGLEALTALVILAGLVLPASRALSFEDDFSTDTGRWIYKYWAERDVVNEYVVLTTPTNNRWGIIWLDEDIIEPFHASFRYKAGDGTRADGLVFMFYKKTDYEPDWGGYLCFCSLPKSSHTPVPGYGIEFDSYYNGGHLNDPSGKHIALLKDRPGSHIVSVNDPRVDDFQWHTVEVYAEDSSVVVILDGEQVLQWNGIIDRTYGGFGFAGATGNKNNWHIIDDVCVTPAQAEMAIDIKPRSCPNPLNTKSKGVLPVAVLGTEYLEVTDIDLGSILLEGVAPIRAAFEDVGRPVGLDPSPRGSVVLGGAQGEPIATDRSGLPDGSDPVHRGGVEISPSKAQRYTERCPCTTDGPDGFQDLSLKFETQEIAAALGAVNDRDTLELVLTAKMVDGKELDGSDCVIILGGDGPKKPRSISVQPQSERRICGDPAVLSLSEALPNPAGGHAVIEYTIPENCDIHLDLYNSVGQKLLTFAEREQRRGSHTVVLSTTDYSPGIYFYRLRAGGHQATGKLVISR